MQWRLLGFEKVTKELTFSETSGTIDAKQTAVIRATFYSIEEKCFKEKFGFQVFFPSDKASLLQGGVFVSYTKTLTLNSSGL